MADEMDYRTKAENKLLKAEESNWQAMSARALVGIGWALLSIAEQVNLAGNERRDG